MNESVPQRTKYYNILHCSDSKNSSFSFTKTCDIINFMDPFHTIAVYFISDIWYRIPSATPLRNEKQHKNVLSNTIEFQCFPYYEMCLFVLFSKKVYLLFKGSSLSIHRSIRCSNVTMKILRDDVVSKLEQTFENRLKFIQCRLPEI